MIKYIVFLMLSFAISFSPAHGANKSQLKYRYGLLTPGYNIVTEDDLAWDAFNRNIEPYDPTTSLSELYWQCFPKEQITAKFNSWRGHNGMGAWNKVSMLCTLEIAVQNNRELQIFADHRGHPVEFCQKFMTQWKRVTKKQKIVCLNGEGGQYQTEAKVGKYKLWTWEKFKTKIGCYSYFASECDTKGCAEGRGACRAKK